MKKEGDPCFSFFHPSFSHTFLSHVCVSAAAAGPQSLLAASSFPTTRPPAHCRATNGRKEISHKHHDAKPLRMASQVSVLFCFLKVNLKCGTNERKNGVLHCGLTSSSCVTSVTSGTGVWRQIVAQLMMTSPRMSS